MTKIITVYDKLVACLDGSNHQNNGCSSVMHMCFLKTIYVNEHQIYHISATSEITLLGLFLCFDKDKMLQRF